MEETIKARWPRDQQYITTRVTDTTSIDEGEKRWIFYLDETLINY